jgi:predicted Rossmann fold flavoprotein
VIDVETRDGLFDLRLAGGDRIRARRLVLATGGKSLPKTGSDGGGFTLARTLGHEIEPTFPVLVPLRTADRSWHALAGVSLPVTLQVRRGDGGVTSCSGGFLFTHQGFSGPAVLDVSRNLTRPDGPANTLEVHWGGSSVDWAARLREAGRATVAGVLRDVLPRRLADLLLVRAGVDGGRRAAELPRGERLALERQLLTCPLPVDGHEGYRTAEATGGGIRLGDLHTKTLESRVTPGLHFAGEMIDVDGRIGGYNFLWAFVSGRRAGQAAGLRAATANG